MSILDSIKDLANKAVATVKDVADDVQDKAVELKADFDEAGGAQGLINKAGTELSELSDDISEVASKAVETVKGTAGNVIDSAQAKASELKADFNEAGGAKGIFDKASNTVKEAANDAVDAIKGTDNPPKA